MGARKAGLYGEYTNRHTYIFGRGSGDLNPGLGEEGAGAKHEDDVDNSMYRII